MAAIWTSNIQNPSRMAAILTSNIHMIKMNDFAINGMCSVM